MSWAILRPQIGNLLRTVSDIQEVSNAPKFTFSGYPAAFITPSESSGDYESNIENLRTYAFAARIFYPTKEIGIEAALASLESLVDSVLDTFDQEDIKQTGRIVGVNLPSSYTFLSLFASPSFWGEVPGENLIMAEIKIIVKISVDVS